MAQFFVGKRGVRSKKKTRVGKKKRKKKRKEKKRKKEPAKSTEDLREADQEGSAAIVQAIDCFVLFRRFFSMVVCFHIFLGSVLTLALQKKKSLNIYRILVQISI